MSEAPAFIGKWHSNPKGGAGRGFGIDEDGRFSSDSYGCTRSGMLPMVVGDYNVFSAEKLPGEGYLRLVYAKVTKDKFRFVWKIKISENHLSEEMTKSRSGKIIAPGVMEYLLDFNSAGSIRLYKLKGSSSAEQEKPGAKERTKTPPESTSGRSLRESASTGSASDENDR